MATVRMPRAIFEAGELPRLCVTSGEPADQTVEATFRWLPPWTNLLLLAEVLPFLIAVLFAEEKIVGRVNVRYRITGRHQRLGRLAWVWFAAALIGGVGAA